MPVARRFRRFPPIPVSSGQVVDEIAEFLGCSNVRQYGSSSNAAVSSERPVGKKVTKDERRAMLESFVKKYRAMNSGKFPTAKTVQKEVGGGYYFLKRMLQELEYNLKVSSVEKELVKENTPSAVGEDAKISDMIIEPSSEIGEVSISQITEDLQLGVDGINTDMTIEGSSDLKEVSSSKITIDSQLCQDAEISDMSIERSSEIEELSISQITKDPQLEDSMNTDMTIEGLPVIKEASSSQITMDPQLHEDALPGSVNNLDIPDSSTHFKLNKGLQTSAVSEELKKDDTHSVTTETHEISGEHLEVLHLHHKKLEQDLKEETQPEDKFKDVPKPRAEQHEQSAVENDRRDSSERRKDDELVPTDKPSLWQNLKSLANVFINVWKKPQ